MNDRLKERIGANFDIFVFAAVWLLLLFAGRSKLFRDPGTFFHTAVGERILHTGCLVRQDPFSFTMYGKEWIAHQWLGECTMALVNRMGGFDGLLAMAAALLALLFGSLARRLAHSGMNPVLGVLLVGMALASSSHHLHVRPHLASILFLAVTYGLLCDYEMRRIRVKRLYWLVPLFIAWTNIHGGVLGGLLTLLLVISGWTVWKLAGLESPIRRGKDATHLWLLGVLCTATTLMSPYGMDLPVTWLSIVRSPYIRETIQEHASLLTLIEHGDSSAVLIIANLLAFGLFYIALIFGTKKSELRTTWMVPLVWLGLFLSSNRNGPLFSVVLLIAIADLYPRVGWVNALSAKGSATFRLWDGSVLFLKRSSRIAIMTVIVAGTAFIYSMAVKPVLESGNWVALDRGHWPIDHLEYLVKYEKELGPGAPIFNDMLYGGFLIYHTPGLRVFIDDRWELYGDDFMRRYIDAGPDDFKQWESRYHFEIALVNPRSSYCSYLNSEEGWKVVAASNAAVLYRKRSTF
jgi:hypothetical protein